MAVSPTKILIVEDNRLDHELLCLALERADFQFEVHVEENGEDAIKYLQSCGKESGHSTVDLVILDVILPKRDGTEVLNVIRNCEALSRVPVVVMSSSKEVIERSFSERGLATEFCVSKPTNLNDLMSLGRAIIGFYESASIAKQTSGVKAMQHGGK
jgi:DNA-binding response OmpR family regulator